MSKRSHRESRLNRKSRSSITIHPERNVATQSVERGIIPFILRHKISALAAAILAAAGIAFVAQNISKRAKSVSTPVSFSETMPDPALFVPAERNTEILRADIPANLQNLIDKFGKVVSFPKNYDPAKPNLYLLTVKHVETLTGQYSEDAYKVQDEILKIFHLLYSIGVERQFLEGVTTGETLYHDVDDPKYNETPIRSMSQYMESGKIKRAYIAAEGVYGDAVESIGVDADTDELVRVANEYQDFNREEFPKVVAQVIEGVGRDLGIDFDYDALSSDPSAPMRLYPLVKEKVDSMKEEDVRKLAEKHVLSNPLYQRWLQVSTKFLYMKIEGRNDAFVSGIRSAGSTTKKDAAFIVGGRHVPGVSEQLERIGDYNLFSIVPNSVDDGSGFIEKPCETEEEYRERIIATDLFNFGLGPEPENPTYW